MAFRSKMQEYGYTPDTVSQSVKKRIKDYMASEQERDELKEKLKDKTIPEAQRKQLTTEISVIDSYLADMDKQLTKDIERLQANGYGKGGKYDQMTATIKAQTPPNRQKKQAATQPAATTVSAPEPAKQPEPPKPEPEPVKQTQQTTPPKPAPSRQQPPAPAPAPAKKKDNSVLLVVGIVGAIVLGFFGWKAYKNR
jgi:hypothetical protein